MARRFIFGTHNTDTEWGLTLTGWKLSAPEYKKAFVSVPGRDGDLDLSTALTDGEPRYNSRELSASFELSSGTRDTRQETLDTITNTLDGRRLNIELPDDSTHYLTGRLQVSVEYNDPAHAALKISAIVDPWRYATTEKSKSGTASSTQKTLTLTNAGRRLVVPTIVISGSGASVQLTFGTKTWTKAAGTYSLPDILLQVGDNALKYKGTGSVAVTWREAVL